MRGASLPGARARSVPRGQHAGLAWQELTPPVAGSQMAPLRAMAHLELTPKRPLSSFRRLALGSWRSAYDPTVYGTLTIRMDRALAYAEAYGRRYGVRLRPLHLVARACAVGMRACPELNALLRFQRIYLRHQVTLSVLAPGPVGAGEALQVVRVEEADRMPLAALVQALDSPPPSVPPTLPAWLARVPPLLLGPVLRLLSFLAYSLNLDPARWGMARDAFGAVILTPLEGLGLEAAYLPLLPLSRAPICVAVGDVEEQPVVEAGEVRPGRVLRVHASFDHRFIDGYHATVLARTVREVLEDPFTHLEPLPPGEGPEGLPGGR